MKVLVVNPSLYAPYYDYHLCRALVEIGVSVTMVGRPLRQYEQLADEPFAFAGVFYRGTTQRTAGWRTSRLSHIGKGLEHAFGLRALENLVIEQRADIVHVQWLMLPFLDRIAFSRLRRRCGLVLTLHNAEISTHSTSTVVGSFGAMIQLLGQKGAVLSFDRYVVHSSKALDRLIELGINPERIIHRPHPPLGLDAPVPLPSAPVAGNRANILFFGSIKPYKGVDVLIEAGIAMFAARRDFRITIAGRPFQSMESLRALIASAGAEDVFHFDLNFLSDAKLAEYLTAASIVVFPYREIDGSGALSHAISFEKPIVASRVGGFSESPFKDYVELVAPEDPGELASTLARLLDEPKRLQDLARQTSTLRSLLPSWNDYALACLEAYREIIPGQTRL